MSAAARAAEARRTARNSREVAARRAGRLRIALATTAVVAVVAACVTLYRSPVFSVTRVEVVGNSNLTREAILARAAVPPDATLIRFPAEEIADRVGSDPWVGSVTVSRVFPDGMRIRVVERRAVAMVDSGAAFWLVDGEGLVIAQRSAEQTSTSIVVRDVPGLDPKPGRRTSSEPLLNAVRVIAGLSAGVMKTVRSISAPTVDGTTLYTSDKVEIVVGEAAELSKKDVLIRRILEEQGGKLVSIDVRTVERPTWRAIPH